jgi:alpha/beta superfamily hydrolase
MDNAVVLAAVRGCLDAGWSAMRFNFGGVGASGGRYGGGVEEIDDVVAAASALRATLPPETPLAIVGYSFGAWVGAQAAARMSGVGRVVAIAPPLRVFGWEFASRSALPLAVIAGDRDTFCPRDRLDALLASTGAADVALAGADHFLAGREDELAAVVRDQLGAA